MWKEMQLFFFTYGSGDQQPYCGGWTMVEAPDYHLACVAFREAHPDRIPGILNCASVYTLEQFQKTCMNGPDGNFGAFCHEIITLKLCISPRYEEVMEDESEEADPEAEGSSV